MGKQEKQPEALGLREGEHKSPEDLARQVRTEYEKKWDRLKAKVDQYKASPDPKLKAVAAQYETRLKSLFDPRLEGPMLDDASIQDHLTKAEGILTKFEQEPIIRFTSMVESHREFLTKTAQQYPGVPIFQKFLDDFEKNIKRFGTPTTDTGVDKALAVLGAYMTDKQFNEAYNREYEKEKITKYVGSKVKEGLQKAFSGSAPEEIAARIQFEIDKIKKTVLGTKPADVLPDTWLFRGKGLAIQVSRDGRVSITGATSKAKEQNPRLASIPTIEENKKTA